MSAIASHVMSSPGASQFGSNVSLSESLSEFESLTDAAPVLSLLLPLSVSLSLLPVDDDASVSDSDSDAELDDGSESDSVCESVWDSVSESVVGVVALVSGSTVSSDEPDDALFDDIVLESDSSSDSSFESSVFSVSDAELVPEPVTPSSSEGQPARASVVRIEQERSKLVLCMKDLGSGRQLSGWVR
jgi:hypothetical protein